MRFFTTLLAIAIVGLCNIAHAEDTTNPPSPPTPAPQTTTATPATTPAKDKGCQGTFQITQVDPQGQFVTLQNGTKYEINKRYRKYTMGWKTGDMVKVFCKKDPKDVKLESVSSGKTVKASCTMGK